MCSVAIAPIRRGSLVNLGKLSSWLGYVKEFKGVSDRLTDGANEDFVRCVAEVLVEAIANLLRCEKLLRAHKRLVCWVLRQNLCLAAQLNELALKPAVVVNHVLEGV